MVLSVASLAKAESFHDPVQDLGAEFWQWRAQEQPFTTDDIPRIERPAGYAVDWSAKTIRKRENELAVYEERWRRTGPGAGASVQQQVDYRLLGSALARVRWELTIEQTWRRDPQFYFDQTVGSVVALLLQPPPFTGARQHEIVLRMRQIPSTIHDAEENLDDIRAPFAELAIASLDDIGDRTRRSESALSSELIEANRKDLLAATPAAIAALEDYRTWLKSKLPTAAKETAIGRENYIYFLRNVALMPYTPEELLAMSRQEWSRSVDFEAYQEERLKGMAPAPIFKSADEQIATEKAQEEKIRQFLGANRILTVPAWMKHYRDLLLPAYLEPFDGVAETDDLTGPSRLDEDGTSYIRRPSAGLGFFYRSTAEDPRSIIVHEGVPGHYFQLCLGWHNPDPLRRHYYDSGANEGIGFYAEEMMLQAGLFDDNAHTRKTIYSFMRLRALRVEVDVKLALGQFTLTQAADYLERTVPMDHRTALSEASMFASTPGQAISYQIGKLQINELLADARRSQGDAFTLLRFNDFVWNNGNVPISLQRWELLHDPSEVPLEMHEPAKTMGKP
jgi:uncharacterized protein (DUF885 family)